MPSQDLDSVENRIQQSIIELEKLMAMAKTREDVGELGRVVAVSLTQFSWMMTKIESKLDGV